MHSSNGATAERPARFEINSDPRKLRESLREVSDMWRWLEPGTARRVRLLLIELVGRSSDPRHHPHGSIRLALRVHPEHVRIEASGPGLLIPSEPVRASRESERLFPPWVIEDLADRWDIDGPSHDQAVWFEIDRRATEWRAA